MSLIKCPECNHEVSDKAEVCIHCGFPLKQLVPSNFILDIDGKKIDVSPALQFVQEKNRHQIFVWLKENCGINDWGIMGSIVRDLENNTLKPSIDDYKKQVKQSSDETIRRLKEQEKAKKEAMKPKCPTCGSTNIRKISNLSRSTSFLVHGLASSKMGKTMECLNPKCGYKW